MSINKKKTKVQIWFEEIFARRDYTHLEDVVAADYRDGPNHNGPTGPEFIKGKYNKLDSVLSNIRVELQDLIAEEDKVVAHYKMTAIHSGPYLGINSTNKEFIQEGMTILRFNKEGKIEYTFGIYDRQRIIQQLTE